ncbi:RusA family crossover junction endodeoxyribonuclease [Kineothrix sedimenti]|uniref:RusA family crossover junction endodeoxyribonuclease n=1 Tax=Kineothrix sedimenti TaxID=3123317 RepID=A0ABZ3ETK1_9FIRM
MKYLLTIPGRLDNLNDYIRAERASKYKGAGMKADNEMLVFMAIRRCLRGVKIQKPVMMSYHWHEKDSRRDLDNISSFGRKVIQDALVKDGILENDGWNNIKGFTDAFYIDKNNPRIEVEIVEIE